MQFIQLPTTVPVYSRIYEDPELSTVSKLIWSFLISWQLVDTIYTVLNRQTRSPNVSDERLQDESVHQPRLDWIRLSTRISKSTREIVIFTTNIIPCPLSWLNCFLKPFPFDTLNDHQSNERENSNEKAWYKSRNKTHQFTVLRLKPNSNTPFHKITIHSCTDQLQISLFPFIW